MTRERCRGGLESLADDGFGDNWVSRIIAAAREPAAMLTAFWPLGDYQAGRQPSTQPRWWNRQRR